MTNLSKRNFTLLSSDHYPSQGFPVNSEAVAKIRKAVSRPSAVIFSAKDDKSKQLLYLNGLYNVSVTPTKSPLQEVKITITRQGLFLFLFIFSCHFSYSGNFQPNNLQLASDLHGVLKEIGVFPGSFFVVYHPNTHCMYSFSY